MVAPSETSNLPGPSMLTCFTVPLSTTIEKRWPRWPMPNAPKSTAPSLKGVTSAGRVDARDREGRSMELTPVTERQTAGITERHRHERREERHGERTGAKGITPARTGEAGDQAGNDQRCDSERRGEDGHGAAGRQPAVLPEPSPEDEALTGVAPGDGRHRTHVWPVALLFQEKCDW